MKRLAFENPIDCAGCGACAAICPCHCIEMGKDTLEFNIPQFAHPERCIDCGLCYRTCPQVKREKTPQHPFCVYGQNRNQKNLLESSSGGFFSLLTEYVLDKGGCVWGVELLPEGLPHFVCIHNKEEVKKIRGSKYSEVKEPLDFKEVRNQLKEGKLVLVSGTPCQILALRKFLGKTKYSNLILVDLLCYGIQSPKMWKLYLQDINPKCKNILYVSMRDKHYSWFNYSMKIIFEDGSHYRMIRYDDPWLRTYSTAMFNRLSCSACQAKKFPHVSDFTIGDFWDIDYYDNPIKLNKKRGVSLVMMHTQISKDIFKSIKINFIYDVIPESYMNKRIVSLEKSASVNKLRNSFILDVYKLGFTPTVNKYMDSGISLWYKKRKLYLRTQIVNKIKAFIKTIICYKK